MSKLDKKPKHVANLPLTSHDLSHTLDFTSSTGMILPLNFDILNPGEKVRCNIDVSQTRTMPVASAAFADIDLHVDYFFVPMTLLYSPFESFIYQINDNYSANFGASTSSLWNRLPLLDLSSLATYIYNLRNEYIGEDDNFDNIGAGCFRLFDMFGLNPFFGSMQDAAGNDTDYKPSVFPWQLLAYNAIYEYFYRLDDYEVFKPARFNMDAYGVSGNEIDTTSPGIWTLHYRPNYMDYFNSVKNSPIVSVTNIADNPSALPLAKSWLSRETAVNSTASATYNVLVNGIVGSSSNDNTTSPNYPLYANTKVNTQFGFSSFNGSSSTNGADINTANLRALFANEKLWSITGATKKSYDAQTLAHFGFNVPTDIKHQVTHLGHDVTPVRIGEVISTATTDDQPLGTVAGKGYGVDVKNRGVSNFTAPCHGVFLCVYTAMVRQTYYNGMMKCHAIADWQDFYQPEFDHLGMQPLFGYERTYDSDDASTIIGWQYRYEQFKRRYNRVTQAFSDGYFSTWNVARRPFGGDAPTATGIPTAYQYSFYQRPTALDDIMVTPYSTTWTDDYLTTPEAIYENDPFVTHAIIDYKKLSSMSAYSMPRLDA